MDEVAKSRLAAALPEGWRLVALSADEPFVSAELYHRVFGSLHLDAPGPLSAQHLIGLIDHHGYIEAAKEMPHPVSDTEARMFGAIQAVMRSADFDRRQIGLIVGLLEESGSISPQYASWLRSGVLDG